MHKHAQLIKARCDVIWYRAPGLVTLRALMWAQGPGFGLVWTRMEPAWTILEVVLEAESQRGLRQSVCVRGGGLVSRLSVVPGSSRVEMGLMTASHITPSSTPTPPPPRSHPLSLRTSAPTVIYGPRYLPASIDTWTFLCHLSPTLSPVLITNSPMSLLPAHPSPRDPWVILPAPHQRGLLM